MEPKTPARSWRQRINRVFHIPFGKQLHNVVGSFSFIEKLFFYVFVILTVGSGIGLLFFLNNGLLVEVPAPGGNMTEGVVGSPRFVNPVLAISDADRDVVALVYSGLLSATPSGELIPNLAKSYSVSEDGLSYTFILRSDITFHDGTPVTSDDVVYTIELAQNDLTKSPKRANWEGVHVEALSPSEVRFVLSQPYSPFLENATLGILPKHLWEVTPADQLPFSVHNAEPVGSGPYKVVDLERDGVGVPKRYELQAFDEYVLGKPYISGITMRFYDNAEELLDAFDDHDVEQIHAIKPETAMELAEKEGARVETFPLPRIFGVFFNQDEAALFTHSEVRDALSMSIDRVALVNAVLYGYGTPATTLFPAGILSDNIENLASDDDTLEDARAILAGHGWKANESGILVKETGSGSATLRFSLSTSNTPELADTAHALERVWEELGAQVDVQLFETGSLNQEVIRPRNYQALLFGQVIGRDLDPLHSGTHHKETTRVVNIALYTNITVDGILEDIRTTFDPAEKEGLYKQLIQEVAHDMPSVFLYSPDFIYVVHDDLKGFNLGTVTTSAERFLDVHEWHLDTQHVWGFLASTNY